METGARFLLSSGGMTAIDRILVPLDGSRLSEAVLPVAGALARAHDAEVVLVETLPAETTGGQDTAEAERYLAERARGLQSGGVSRVRWGVWYGAVGQSIVNAAAREAADLVAMGTHGRGGLGRLLLGSVAEGVVRHSPVPVLLLRGEMPAGETGVGAVAVGLDGSPYAEAVLPTVVRLAGPLDLTIHLVHALEPLPIGVVAEAGQLLGRAMAARRTEMAGYLAEIAQRLEGQGLRVRWTVLEGSPAMALDQYARHAGVRLIAVTTHGRTGLERLVVGSVAEQLLKAAAVPVLMWTRARGPGAAG